MDFFGLAKASYKAVRNVFSVRGKLRSGDYAWIYDNFYLIDGAYTELRRLKLDAKDREKLPRLFRLCDDTRFMLDEKQLTNYLSASASGERYSSEFLYALPALTAGCALIKIGEIIEGGNDGALLGSCVTLIRMSNELDADTLFAAAWLPEGLLSSELEMYGEFDRETRNLYRDRVHKTAKRLKITELTAAELLLHEGFDSAEKSFRKTVCALYFSLTVLASLAVTAFAVYLWGFLGVLLLLPVYAAATSVGDALLSTAKRHNAEKISLKEVPDYARTLVTVSTLLLGSDSDSEVFGSLASFSQSNPGKNIVFCLLADLPDGKEKHEEGDEDKIDYAKKRIDELCSSFGDRFCMFLREREYDEKDRLYRGRDRKRGAIKELAGALMSGNTEKFYGNADVSNIRYICALDRDTCLPLCGVKELLETALHPANKPVVKNGRVVSGYGLIQPAIKTALADAYRTYFSRLISGEAGGDIYVGAAFDRYTSLFGSGVFCGKGLFDVFLFNELVSPVIPDGAVLSHDIVEGEILRTKFVSEIVFTDSCPSSPLSFCKRLHRWVRGDVQNLVMLKSKTLATQSRFKLVNNVITLLTHVFSLASLTIGGLLRFSHPLLLTALSLANILVPLLLTLIASVIAGEAFTLRRYFSRCLSSLCRAGCYALWQISFLAVNAAVCADGFVRALSRMASGKKLLEWTTALQSESKGTLGAYFKNSVFSVIVGACLTVFSGHPVTVLAGLCLLAYPVSAYLLSARLPEEEKSNLTASDKKKLTSDVSAMWGFFASAVNKSTAYLPPDNIQYSPELKTAMRTSPTNIGFYLVSVAAARDFGLIDTPEMTERLLCCLNSVKTLQTERGCLYNWYDLKTKKPLGSYVSSVDLGNFLCCLTALKSALYERAGEDTRLLDVIDICTDIIKNSDFGLFYDEKRCLFSLGFDAVKGAPDKVCYDLYMSEFRLSAYYAVAKNYAGKRSWQRLGRTCASYGGYMGMLSWSGTAFEYFMPQLFLPAYPESFAAESLSFAYMLQRRMRFGKLFGVSESGFYAFDSDMNYAYKAHGVEKLALKRYDGDNRVLSPYSAYLSLCLGRRESVKTLCAFGDAGMYGEHGLYEAIDFTSDASGEGLIVRSYMSHHVGMSIIAAANAVFDGIFVRRFMSDRAMAAADELLKERVPTGVRLFGDEAIKATAELRPRYAAKTLSGFASLSHPEFTLLTGNGVSAVCSTSGHVRLMFGGCSINECGFNKYELFPSLAVRFFDGYFSYGCAPLHGDGVYSGEYGFGSVTYLNSSKAFTGRTKIAVSRTRPGFFVDLSADNRKSYRVTLAFSPMLCRERDFDSHPAFSKLFITSEYDSETNALYFTRRGRGSCRVVCVSPRDISKKLDFCVSKGALPAYGLSSVSDLDGITVDNKDGVCVDPLCVLRTGFVRGGRAGFIITAGETLSAAKSNLKALRGETRENSLSAPQPELLSLCLRRCCMRRDIAMREVVAMRYDLLWRHGISGDCPLFVFALSSSCEEAAKQWLYAYAALARGFIRAEAVFCVREQDNYNRPAEAMVKRICASLGLANYIGRRNGIFILRDEPNELKRIADIYADLDTRLRPDEETAFADTLPAIITKTLLPQGETDTLALKLFDGGFTENGYSVSANPLPLPRTFVLAGERGFGSILTHASLGYSFFGNAREKRLTRFSSDPYSYSDGERLLCRLGSSLYDLISCSSSASFTPGNVEYRGCIAGASYSVSVTVCAELPLKLFSVTFDRKTDCSVTLLLRPCAGSGIEADTRACAAVKHCGETPYFLFSGGLCRDNPFFGFAGGDGCVLSTDYSLITTGVVSGDSDVMALTQKGGGCFFLGGCDDVREAPDIIARFRKTGVNVCQSEAAAFASGFIPPINASLRSKSLSMLVNLMLPLQTGVCRFLARASFWQAGGAFGFRDQLQDCMMLVYSRPDLVRAHIINCCSHQYEEGDVMHWWHDGIGGVRTRCSDDKLWLPIVADDYIHRTGDALILTETAPFLYSQPLLNEDSRYEAFMTRSERGSVEEHCVRALLNVTFGKNGLAEMGSCDWNDAFSEMGGESMLTTFLFITAVNAFARHITSDETRSELLCRAENALESAEKHFAGDRYIRAIASDGTVYGASGCGECEIDAAVQAFAVFAGASNAAKAVRTAFKLLYSGEYKLLKLLYPPFDNGDSPAGAIRDYPPGIRENGGQYTHGAIWLARAAFMCGETETGLCLTSDLNPATRGNDRQSAETYKGEFYAMPADIYFAEGQKGRAGWSWYTGSAGWYYKLLLENLMGIEISGGFRFITVKPESEYSCDIRLPSGTLRIESRRGSESPLLDGGKISFPLEILGKSHVLQVFFGE